MVRDVAVKNPMKVLLTLVSARLTRIRVSAESLYSHYLTTLTSVCNTLYTTILLSETALDNICGLQKSCNIDII